MRRVSMEEALHWNFDVSDSEFHQMLSYLMDQLDAGNIEPILAPLAAGDLLSIPGLNDENRSLAREIDRKINSLIKENRIR